MNDESENVPRCAVCDINVYAAEPYEIGGELGVPILVCEQCFDYDISQLIIRSIPELREAQLKKITEREQRKKLSEFGVWLPKSQDID